MNAIFKLSAVEAPPVSFRSRRAAAFSDAIFVDFLGFAQNREEDSEKKRTLVVAGSRQVYTSQSPSAARIDDII